MYALKQTQLLPTVQPRWRDGLAVETKLTPQNRFLFLFFLANPYPAQPAHNAGGSGAGRGQHETRHKTLTWTRQAVAKVLLLQQKRMVRLM